MPSLSLIGKSGSNRELWLAGKSWSMNLTPSGSPSSVSCQDFRWSDDGAPAEEEEGGFVVVVVVDAILFMLSDRSIDLTDGMIEQGQYWRSI